MDPLIHRSTPKGEILHRHDWGTQTGADLRSWRESLSPQAKHDVSEIQGESWGYRYATEILGYQEVFQADNKSIRQGMDGLYYDPAQEELVVAEFKGQGARLTQLQRRPDWSIATCEKIQRRQFPYHQVSDYEREFAQHVLDRYQAGDRIRYEVIRTQVDMKTGAYWSQLEKRTYLEQGVAQKYPAQTLNPGLDRH